MLFIRSFLSYLNEPDNRIHCKICLFIMNNLFYLPSADVVSLFVRLKKLSLVGAFL